MEKRARHVRVYSRDDAGAPELEGCLVSALAQMQRKLSGFFTAMLAYGGTTGLCRFLNARLPVNLAVGFDRAGIGLDLCRVVLQLSLHQILQAVTQGCHVIR